MFKEPFSFEGRIRRTEYGISYIICTVIQNVVPLIIGAMIAGSSAYSSLFDSTGAIVALLVFYIPLLWFILAQGAKRCHDLGHNGWWRSEEHTSELQSH